MGKPRRRWVRRWQRWKGTADILHDQGVCQRHTPNSCAHSACQAWHGLLGHVFAHALSLGARGMHPVRCIAQDATILLWICDASELLNWDANAMPRHMDTATDQPLSHSAPGAPTPLLTYLLGSRSAPAVSCLE
jgi:hypothetical protein